MKELEILTSHLGAGILLGVLYLGWLLRAFSRRMGEVTKMRPYYRGFDAGNILVLIALLSYIFQCSAALTHQPAAILDATFSLGAFYVPLALGIGVNLALALIYWGWILKQR